MFQFYLCGVEEPGFSVSASPMLHYVNILLCFSFIHVALSGPFSLCFAFIHVASVNPFPAKAFVLLVKIALKKSLREDLLASNVSFETLVPFWSA